MAAVDVPFVLEALVFFPVLAVALTLFLLPMHALGASAKWHLELADSQPYRIGVVMSFTPPTGSFVILVNGEEQARKRGSWTFTERIEFAYGHDPLHQGLVTIRAIFWPLPPYYLELQVDGQTLTTT